MNKPARCSVIFFGCILSLALSSVVWAGNSLQKVRVTDPVIARQLTQVGAKVVADYGSFQVLEAGGETVGNVAGVEVRPDYNVIQLNAGAIHTTTPAAQALRAPVGSFAGKRLHLIQFGGPVREDWRQALEKTGVQTVTYIANNAFLIYGDQAALQRVQTWAQSVAYVQWDASYLDAYKIGPSARTVDANGAPRELPTDMFAIQLVANPDANAGTLAVINQLGLAPVQRDWNRLGYRNLIVRLPANQLAQIAARPDVISIHLNPTPQKFDERQNMIISGNLAGSVPTGPGYLSWLTSRGFDQAQFTASGFVVDVTDSGVDNATTTPNHFGLYVSGDTNAASRFVYARLEGDPNAGILAGCDGHGNLNAHIIGGFNDLSAFPHTDSAGFRFGLGVCPFVRVGSSVIFDPDFFTFPDYTDLASRAYRDGARISNNSWGAAVGGEYTVDAQEYDALVRDSQPAGAAVPAAGLQEFTFVFANGNSGPLSETVGSPATAKNVISVGAGENVQPFGGSDGSGIGDSGADSADDIIYFSSRGPCTDGRMKPDLVAPGTHVSGGVYQEPNPGPTGTAAACYDGSGVSGGVSSDFYPPGQEFYTASSGTSHSAPAVAGAAALVRQSFINEGRNVPSPAMVKAYLMNSTRFMTGNSANDSLWSPNQGMGGLDLGRAFDGRPRLLRDQVPGQTFTTTGEQQTFNGAIADPSAPVRVTLAWTDAPGSTAGNAYNNDLDLEVVVGGVTYRGNNFVGAHSVSGGAADPRNNVESVFLPAGTTGGITIRVRAANLNSDGVPGNGAVVDQDFALVGYNIQDAGELALTVGEAIVTGGNGNGVLDPNECNSISVVFTNTSTNNIAGPIELGLRALTPGVIVVDNFAGLSNVTIVGGAVVTSAPPFTVTTSPVFPCGQPIDFEVTIKTGSNGVVTTVMQLPTAPVVSAPERWDGGSGSLPDLATVDFTNEVSGLSGVVGDVDVSLKITHLWISDLVLSLISPAGTEVILSQNNGGNDRAYGTGCVDSNRTTFADDALVAIADGSPPYAGTFQPQQLLATFNGEDPNGAWVLRVRDTQVFDDGDLACWSLFLATTTCTNGAGPCAPIPQVCVLDSVSFGSLLSGTASDPRSIIVTNCGTLDLVMTNVAVTGADTANFLIVSDTCVGTPIPPGGTCTITVQFAPLITDPNLVTQTFNAALVLESNAPDSPALVSLTGTGTRCGAVVIGPAVLPTALIGVPYSAQLVQAGGTTPVTFIRTAGTYPTGLTMDTTGLLSGTPAEGGAFAFKVKVIDATGCQGEKWYTVTVACSAITTLPTVLPVGQIGVAYSQQLTAQNGTAPHTFTVEGGSLPAGLSLSSDGLLSGTPLSGSSTFGVRVTDANGCSSLVTYTITLADPPPAIFVDPPTLRAAAVNVAYQQTLAATGGTAPHSFAVESGSLPAGLSLSSAGQLTGTATGTGNATFTVRATDALGRVGSRAYVLAVKPGLTDLAVALTTPATVVTEGDAVALTVTIRNQGELPAANVALTGSLVMTNLGTVAAGGSLTLEVVVTADVAGTLTHTVTVESDLADPEAGNDVAQVSLPVQARPHSTVQFAAVSQTAGTTGSAVVTVRRTGNPQAAATVNFYTVDGTARAGVDYVAASGVVNFAAGETTKTVTIALLNGAGSRSFQIRLTSPGSGVVVGGVSQITVNLVKGAGAANTATVTEPDGDMATVVLLGAGVLTVSEAAEGGIEEIAVTGGDAASSLVVSVRTAGNGAVSIGRINVVGSLKTLTTGASDLSGTKIHVSGSLGSLRAGALTGVRVSAGGSIGTVRVTALTDSSVAAGFTPVDEAALFAGGVFAPGRFIKAVKAQNLVGSTLAAAAIGKVQAAAVAVDNGGQPFGILAQDSIGSVSLRSPAFKWDKNGAKDQGVGDFHVQW
jgi:subtilisin-like proprotein convertase family protein